MPPPPHEPDVPDSSGGDRDRPSGGNNHAHGREKGWGVFLAGIFGLWFLFFAIGWVVERRDPDTPLGTLIAAAGFTLWLGLMTVGGIGLAARKPWADRFINRLLGLAALAFQAIIACHLAIGIAARRPPNALSCYAFAVWVGVGWVMYLGGWGKTSRPAYLDCAIWPLLLFFKAPGASILLAVGLAGLVGAGEWIGRLFRYPQIGAAVGFGTFLAAVALLARGRVSAKDIAGEEKPPEDREEKR